MNFRSIIRLGLAMPALLPSIYSSSAPAHDLVRIPRSSKFYVPNGKREVARRLRQIKAGQLQVKE